MELLIAPIVLSLFLVGLILWLVNYKPKNLKMTVTIYAQYERYCQKILKERKSDFRISSRMQKYIPGQYVKGYRKQMTDIPIKGYVLGSWYYDYGGGYFLLRKDTREIIQVINVIPL